MTEDLSLKVISRIRDALVQKGISMKELFRRLDTNENGLVTFVEFSDNLDDIIKLSPTLKEQLFAIMDINNIGMVDYQQFLEVMKRTAVSVKPVRVDDTFAWEEDIVQKMKDWIVKENITIEEAFKAFDRDFDGYIGLQDLKWVLTNILKEDDSKPIPLSKLQRLFKLLDFYKTGHIQQCDLQRLVENENPYQTTGKLSNTKFMTKNDTFDWKNNAIQQIGLELSKKYGSVQESFNFKTSKVKL
jgi:Ca2+-binding EF-hand superfamily protein